MLIVILAALLQTVSGRAQVAASNTKHFNKNGLEFDYPATWKVAERKGEESEYVELATETKSTQLIVNWQFGEILDCEWEGARARITSALMERVAKQIQAETPSIATWQEMRSQAMKHCVILR